MASMKRSRESEKCCENIEHFEDASSYDNIPLSQKNALSSYLSSGEKVYIKRTVSSSGQKRVHFLVNESGKTSSLKSRADVVRFLDSRNYLGLTVKDF